MAPHVPVIGVQPVRANAAWVSLKNGSPSAIDYWDSIADGLSARRPGELYFAHLQALLDEIVLVDEADIAEAHFLLLSRCAYVDSRGLLNVQDSERRCSPDGAEQS